MVDRRVVFEPLLRTIPAVARAPAGPAGGGA